MWRGVAWRGMAGGAFTCAAMPWCGQIAFLWQATTKSHILCPMASVFWQLPSRDHFQCFFTSCSMHGGNWVLGGALDTKQTPTISILAPSANKQQLPQNVSRSCNAAACGEGGDDGGGSHNGGAAPAAPEVDTAHVMSGGVLALRRAMAPANPCMLAAGRQQAGRQVFVCVLCDCVSVRVSVCD